MDKKRQEVAQRQKERQEEERRKQMGPQKKPFVKVVQVKGSADVRMIRNDLSLKGCGRQRNSCHRRLKKNRARHLSPRDLVLLRRHHQKVLSMHWTLRKVKQKLSITLVPENLQVNHSTAKTRNEEEQRKSKKMK
jgi:hypothetical protein